jgi:UDP:flavonoid glycosyltransferase YjiC (YdhE family)
LLRLAKAIAGKGHDVTLASSSLWRQVVSDAGVAFAPIPPTFPEPHELPAFFKQLAGTREEVGIEDFASKVEPAIGQLLADATSEQYAVLRDLVDPGTVVVINVGVPAYGAFALAEDLGLKRANVILEPGMLGRETDRATDRASEAHHPGASGRGERQKTDAGVLGPVARFRASLGLPADPRRWGDLNLALFSMALAPPQPEWPANTVVTGFPYGEPSSTLEDDVAAFLGGNEVLVFTLGSADVLLAGDFFDVSVDAARKVGRPALCIGKRPTEPPSSDVLCVPEAPYSAVFPRSAVIVHQGGIGTLAEGLRSGRPMLVVPARADQFDNADLAERLGSARTLQRVEYTSATAATEIERLLDMPEYADRAREVQDYVASEAGLSAAVEHLEAMA